MGEHEEVFYPISQDIFDNHAMFEARSTNFNW